MAKKDAAEKPRLSLQAQKSLVSYVKSVLVAHKQAQEIFNKMEEIDKAYARYQLKGEGGDTAAANVFAEDNVVAPIVVSQVDSMVAYLAEVFLSGYPLFPVVSTPAKRKWAEQLETLLDDHAILGGYARQLLLFLRDCVKYNYGAIEADWDSIEQFEVMQDYLAVETRIDRTPKGMTKVKRLDPYNVIRDDTVAPGDVAELGDFAGYVDMLSYTKLKRETIKYSKQKEAYNINEALASTSPGPSMNYRIHPEISDYVSAKRPLDRVDWAGWFDGPGKRSKRPQGMATYERVTLYARIIPSEHGIISPQPNTPQIWKLVVINGEVLIHAKRIISAYDRLPILFGQPMEDGLGYQTQSIAESEIPIQKAATTLFNMRFSAARRAVSDRALYDPTMINPADINSPVPAPKIPVRVNQIVKGVGLESAYKQIPFDLRGTETAFQDASVLVDFSKQLSGLNNPQQGQFQKGNKSVQEWNDTMGGSTGRLRLPALCLEHQVFVWLKNILVLNIYQYGEDSIVVSQKSGEALEVNINELRQQVMSFRVADGYTPKAKLASTDMITTGLQMIANSPILQQFYGAALPSMFAHMMALGGVKGLDEYSPEKQEQAPAAVAPLGGSPAAAPTTQAVAPGQGPAMVPGQPSINPVA